MRDLTKSYRLYAKHADRLKETLWPRKARHSLFHALNSVSFEVYPGEHLGIIGQNGAGKSTLLQILTGVLTPTLGTVEVNGRLAALLELGSGFNPELSGQENVIFQMQLAGIKDANLPAKLEEARAFADIGDFFVQPVKLYSSGMFARLAFAMNIATLPDILIVDEALSVGDAFFQQKCLRRMKEYRERGTILFVSHDTASVVELCDNVLWLENGHVREYGPAKDVCEHYLASGYSKTFASEQAIAQVLSAESCNGRDASTQHPVAQDYDAVQRHFTELREEPISDFAGRDFFGDGGATILRCMLENKTSGSTLFTSDDLCRMTVYFRCTKDISNVIVGFIFKDRLGKAIYGTNSFRYHKYWPCKARETYAAVFEFVLPDLAPGEYILTLAVAEGTLQTHRQLHWIYDAMTLQFESKENDGTVIAAKCTRCFLVGERDVE